MTSMPSRMRAIRPDMVPITPSTTRGAVRDAMTWPTNPTRRAIIFSLDSVASDTTAPVLSTGPLVKTASMMRCRIRDSSAI